MRKSIAIAALLVTVLTGAVSVQANAVPTGNIITAAWQPVARINPQKAYKVQIVNQAGIPVEYASTSNEFAPRQLQPGATGLLTQLPLPIYLLINSVDARFNLKCSVSANQNVVTVTVRQLPDDQPGNSTVDIQKTGGIFVY
ncbi:MAG: hypothetical protein IGS48_03605 [Oscillatoriales cyanobacterium C42_A2020_001]|nr:hypothetical protein [Leptolyngbyaceae cyanobacterium C42_A2020_001]